MKKRPLRHSLLIATLAALFAAAPPANAEEEAPDESHGVTFTMTTGVLAPVIVDSG